MAQKIDAQEKTILEYLSKNKFLIPPYQRPYTWEQDQCEDLWNDIVDFFIENKDKDNDDKKYFLGSIVLYEDKEKQNIIDGQQRTTTLSLLICALYDKAFNQKSEETQRLVSNLEACLWTSDPISGKVNYSKFHLESKVAIDSDNEMLHSILGNKYTLCDEKDIDETIKKSESNYEKNYLFFIKKSNEFANEYPTYWERLCITILNNCYVLPIECQGKDEDDRFDNALRIFNTLNNRGIPLSDSDIFKGEIIKNKKTKEEREAFINDWKEIETQQNIQFLFYQYLHIIRAKNGEKDNVIGLRQFFMQKHKGILSQPESMEYIKKLSEYWSGIYNSKYTNKMHQLYGVLTEFPSDYWKYLESVCYIYCIENNINFIAKFEEFLPKIVANLLVKFIDKPTISVIKPIIFNGYVSLYQSGKLDFNTDCKQILKNSDLFKEQFFRTKKLTPSLIMLNLILKYPKQTLENTAKWQVEHIFPQTTKWRKSYTGWDKEEAKPYIESIGNKMWLEERHNIWANNKYFDDKKEVYKKSKILEAKELANYPKNDWLKEDIEIRNEEIYKRLLKFFKDNI